MSNKLPYDAILALANSMDKAGNLNNESRARIDSAVDAFLAHEAPSIVTTGWDLLGRFPLSIAEAMRNYAVQNHSHLAPDIFCDIYARDTVGDAVFTKRNIVQSQGWKRLLVITSDYHAARTRAIFNFIYGPDYDVYVRSVASEVADKIHEKEQKSIAAFHNTFLGISPGDDLAIWQRLQQKHPFYNGEIYPQI